MELSEKDLIYRVAGEYLRAREPEEIEEFEVVFDSTFGTLKRQLQGDSAPVVQEAHGRLRFDSPFIDVTAIASVTWIVTLLVRTIARGPREADILVRLDELQAQLVEYTGQLERVAGIVEALKRRVDDLSRLRKEREEPSIRESETSTGPVDLLLRVRTRPVMGGLKLDYELTSPSGRLDLQAIETGSERLNVADLKREHVRLFSGLERLLRQLGEDGEPLLGEEIGDELLARGQDLYLRLFPEQLKDFYRRFRDQIRSLLVVSDEPWIPWELIRPDEFDDDDFLCLRFSMARWFADPHGPAPAIQMERLLCAEAAEVGDYPVLRSAREERERLATLVSEVPGLTGEILEDVRFAEFTGRLKRGGFDLIHFAGHADHEAEDPDRSKLLLTDRTFRASRIAGEIQRRIAEARPLVVLNACRAARAGLALTGVGGWPDRWVRLGRCGALLCPQWAVRDGSAGAFAETFYSQLREGVTLGEAVLEARRRLREADPADPTYLAYSLYGHPNAVVGFGDEAAALPRGRVIFEAASPESQPRDIDREQGEVIVPEPAVGFLDQVAAFTGAWFRSLRRSVQRQPLASALWGAALGLGLLVAAAFWLGLRTQWAREKLLHLPTHLEYPLSLLIGTGFKALTTLPWKAVLALFQGHPGVVWSAWTLLTVAILGIAASRTLRLPSLLLLAWLGLSAIVLAFGTALYTFAVRPSISTGPRDTSTSLPADDGDPLTRFPRLSDNIRDRIAFEISSWLRNGSRLNDVYRESLNGLVFWLLLAAAAGLWTGTQIRESGVASVASGILVAVHGLLVLFLLQQLPRAHALGEWGLKYPSVLRVDCAADAAMDSALADDLASEACRVYDTSAGGRPRRLRSQGDCRSKWYDLDLECTLIPGEREVVVGQEVSRTPEGTENETPEGAKTR